MVKEKNALATFFDQSARRPWVETLRGPALSLPNECKQYVLKGELYIEYLENRPNGGVPNKNHVIFQIPFVDSGYKLKVENRSETVRGARIAMDISEEFNLFERIDEDSLEDEYVDMHTEEDYFPGTLYLKLLTYSGKSTAANKITIFSNLDFITLGEFVDFLASKNLHKMSFLGYENNSWKGCRDFITQTFLQLLRENKVAETDQDGKTLRETITKVHRKNDSYDKLIDRGLFFDYSPIYPDYIKDAYEDEPDSIKR